MPRMVELRTRRKSTQCNVRRSCEVGHSCDAGFAALWDSFCSIPPRFCASLLDVALLSGLYILCRDAVGQHMDGSQQTATGKGEQHTADLEELTLFLTNCVGHSLVAPSDAESLAFLAFWWNGPQSRGLTSAHITYPVQLGLLATLSRRVSCKEDM